MAGKRGSKKGPQSDGRRYSHEGAWRSVHDADHVVQAVEDGADPESFGFSADEVDLIRLLAQE